MTAELHRLGNGLSVALDPLPGAESVALGLYAKVGSRSEPQPLSGLAHLVEHMVFKGAGGRDTRALAEAIEDVGGHLNAWTSRDQTAFHGRALAKDLPLLAELIADLVRAPHFDDAHLEREKQVILSELGECVDSPDDLVHDHLFEAAFDGQAIGRSVLGSAETVRTIARDDCFGWLEQQFVPSRLIFAASGKVDGDALLRLAERLFGDMEAKPEPAIEPARFTRGVRNDCRVFEQTHWCLALPGLPSGDAGVPALSIFVQALGGGTSSRLFQELREERGLAYSIYAWNQGFAETGLVGIGCAAERARAADSIALAREVLGQAVETLSEAEVQRARAQIEAGLLMSQEMAQARADHIARSVEIFGRIVPIDEIVGQLRSVDAAAARAAGAALLDGPVAVASVGAKLALAA
jgi:predicted Zn-dependent peptidase